MQRREFLQMSALGLAAAGLGVGCAAKDQAQVRGVQLYTLRALMEKDVAGTLATVANIGYRQVEFAGYFGLQPKALRKILDGEGLTAPAAHLPLSELENNLPRAIEAAQALGHQYLVLPWLAEDRRNPESYRRLADQFNRWGEQCRAAGVRFAYHNHEFEFEAEGDFLPYDWLLENTDPQLVSFEMDLFWLRKAKRDPLHYFSKHGGRFPLWHVKDMDKSGNMVDVGRGIIDFQSIIDKSNIAGYEYGFIEHDQPEDPVDSIQTAYSTMSNWRRG